MSSKTWFITGTSRGFGREWTEAALERGDSVAATARDASTPGRPGRAVRRRAAAARARRHRPGGRLRRGRAGPRALRAARRRRQQRRLRPVRHGRGAQRERGARRRSRPTCSARSGSPRRRCRSCASRAVATSSRCRRSAASRRSRRSGSTTRPSGRWRASRQALAQEVAGFGIKVTIIEPGGYSTDWGGSSAKHATEIDAYDEVRRPPPTGRAVVAHPVTRSPPGTRS